MGIVGDAAARHTRLGSGVHDLEISPLPLGAPFATPWIRPDTLKADTAVFGLSLARPYARITPAPPLKYDEDLQVAVPTFAGPWDEAVIHRLATSEATIERTASTGTITQTVDPCGCPDRDRDTDPSDRVRD